MIGDDRDGPNHNACWYSLATSHRSPRVLGPLQCSRQVRASWSKKAGEQMPHRHLSLPCGGSTCIWPAADAVGASYSSSSVQASQQFLCTTGSFDRAEALLSCQIRHRQRPLPRKNCCIVSRAPANQLSRKRFIRHARCFLFGDNGRRRPYVE